MNQSKRKFLAALLAGLMLAGVAAQGAVFADETEPFTVTEDLQSEGEIVPQGEIGERNGISTETALRAALESAEAGSTLQLKGNISLASPLTITKRVNLEGNATIQGSVIYQFSETQSGASLTVKGITFKGTDTGVGLTFRGDQPNDGYALKIEVEDCTFNDYAFGLGVFSHANGYELTVRDCVFNSDCGVCFNYDVITSGQEANNSLIFEGNNSTSSTGYAVQKFDNATPNVTNVYYETIEDYEQNDGIPADEIGTRTYVSDAGELTKALTSAANGATIVLAEDIALTATVANNAAALTFATAGVTLDGNGHTLTINANNESGNALGVNASNITIQDLVIAKAADGSVKHGINVYKATNVTIKDVTVQNMDGFGLLVNASDVTATGKLELSGNGWGDYINVGWGNGITDRDSCSFNASGATLVGVDRVYADKDDVSRAGNVAITFSLPSAYVKGQPEGTEGGIYYVYQEPAPEPDPEPGDPSYPPTPVPDDDDDDTDSAGGSTGGSSAGDTEMPENGFGTDENGDTFFYEDGELVTGWVKDGDTWYYMDKETGAMNTEDWVQVNGTWYNFDEDGSMNTGWEQVNGTWYYMAESGAMTTGWQKVDGSWYYMQTWGGMTTGWQQVNGIWYYLKESGAMATGWQQIDGTWYYLKDWGGMATGWQEVNGKWYYFYASGAMAADTTIDGYTVDASGAWVK